MIEAISINEQKTVDFYLEMNEKKSLNKLLDPYIYLKNTLSLRMHLYNLAIHWSDISESIQIEIAFKIILAA
jgi:hypothetical protein